MHRFISIIGGIEIVIGALLNIFTQWPAWISWILCATGILMVLVSIPWDAARQRIKKLFAGPIYWNFENFLGGSCEENGPIYIAVFQPQGVVRKDGVEVTDAYLRSNTTGARLPVRLRTLSAYVDPSETNPIPRGANIRAQGLFYDPSLPRVSLREGMIEGDFLREWGGFDFCTIVNGREFRREFSLKRITKKIDGMRYRVTSTPRVTSKDKVPG